MKKLISLRSQNLNGSKRLEVDEPFEMSEGSARFLVKTGRARYADDEPIEPPKKSKNYNRRDMRPTR